MTVVLTRELVQVVVLPRAGARRHGATSHGNRTGSENGHTPQLALLIACGKRDGAAHPQGASHAAVRYSKTLPAVAQGCEHRHHGFDKTETLRALRAKAPLRQSPGTDRPLWPHYCRFHPFHLHKRPQRFAPLQDVSARPRAWAYHRASPFQ